MLSYNHREAIKPLDNMRGQNMTKTLFMNTETNPWNKPHYVKVTATKIDEIEEHVENLYKDENGKHYEVGYNSCLRRYEFFKV